jgi:hypothetical protein
MNKGLICSINQVTIKDGWQSEKIWRYLNLEMSSRFREITINLRKILESQLQLFQKVKLHLKLQ